MNHQINTKGFGVIGDDDWTTSEHLRGKTDRFGKGSAETNNARIIRITSATSPLVAGSAPQNASRKRMQKHQWLAGSGTSKATKPGDWANN
jgi:hypothetical protein